MNDDAERASEDQIFRVSRTHVRARNRNTMVGFVLAVALCLIVWRARVASSDEYNATLMTAVIAFVVLFGVVHLAGHIRYTLNSSRHQVEVGQDRITFTTGQERTVLNLAEVLLVESQKRLGEGPSLMMKLRNRRVVRLEGYERQAHLMTLVTERCEQISASSAHDRETTT